MTASHPDTRAFASEPPAHARALPQARHVQRDSRARRRHDAGFRVAVMVALIAVALYALAPRMDGLGPAGSTLASWRAGIDQGRDWLARQGDAAADSLRAVLGRP